MKIFNDCLNYLNTNNGVSILVSSVSALISAIAVVIALYFNAKTQNQHKKSLEPQLSMQGETINGMLYLHVQNAGRTAAQSIRIDVISIEGNGSNALSLDSLFSQSFDLYPNEKIQAMVAISGENIGTGKLYPKLTVRIIYYVFGTKSEIQYTRTVTFSDGYDTKIFADVGIDLDEITSYLGATARATVRTANYLDGTQVAVFDELNILAGASLKTDLCFAAEKTPPQNCKDS